MPYLIQERPEKSRQFYVFTADADGKPTGEAHNAEPYASKRDALPLLRALYANADAATKELDAADVEVRVYDDAPALYPQDMVHYVPQSTHPDHYCGNCAQWRAGLCVLVVPQPEPIVATGWCDLWIAPDVAVPDGDLPLAQPIEFPGGYPYTPDNDPYNQYSSAPEQPMTPTLQETLTQDLPLPRVVREVYASNFGGKFPKVPFAPGVDADALLKDDPDPFFVTLPIARVNAVSANGLLYTRELVESIVAQINADKPTGIRGHIKDEDRATAYPNPDVYWVGAVMQGDTAFAKGYIPPGDTRQEYRIKKKVKSDVATSIYGKPRNVVPLADGRYTLELTLEQIDLAPPKRAALFLGGDFEVSAEMTTDNPVSESNSEEITMSIPEDVRNSLMGLPDEELMEMMGDSRMDTLMQMYSAKKNKKMVAAEMEAIPAATLAEMQQTSTRVAELTAVVETQKTALAQFQAEKFDTALDAAVSELTAWNVASDDGKDKLANLRTVLKSATLAEMGAERETSKLAAAAQAAYTKNRFVAEAIRDQLAGPSALQGTPLKPAFGIASPEEIEAARARTGI